MSASSKSLLINAKKPVNWRIAFAAIPILCMISLGAGPVDARAKKTVTVDGSRVKGAIDRGLLSFKGIPYALAPVGDLRWRAPVPVKPWHGVKSATAFAHDCMQVPYPSDAAPLGAVPDEDCLALNVWAPARAQEKALPVVFWIHGGGFVNGGASPDVYDGTAFARDGVVFVSLNYRLGRLGFFAHPALLAEGHPVGNFALMDIIAALHWVKRNIAQFGGDPNQITVMGESAGGASVLSLIASNQAAGLFHRAIVMSGGGRRIMPSLRKTEGYEGVSAEAMALNFAHRIGVKGEGQQALAELRALPAATIVDGLNLGSNKKSSQKSEWTNGPIVDGYTLKQSSETAMKTGAVHWVPLMIGVTDDDIGRYSATSKAELLSQFGAYADRIGQAYDPHGDSPFPVMARAIARDQGMTEPARFVAQSAANAGQPVYQYRFAYVAEGLRHTGRGARHASDVPYFFDTVSTKYGSETTALDRQAAQLAHDYVVNFIKFGDPNGKDLPDWRMYTEDAPKILEMDRNAKAICKDDPINSRLDLIQKTIQIKMGN